LSQLLHIGLERNITQGDRTKLFLGSSQRCLQ